MKKTVLFILGFLFVVSFLGAQFWTLDFESAVGYTTSVTEFTDTYYDYWIRTDGSDHGTGAIYNGPIGSYYFAGQDLDGEGATLPLFIDIDDIDISGQTNLEFRIYLAEDQAGDGNEDWDNADYFHIGYDIDNSGTFTNLLWVESDDYLGTGYNGTPRIDTDFDGVGDGTEITDTFVQFTASIPGTGSLIDIQIEFYLNSGDEDIALDNLQLFAAGGNSLPAITNVIHTPDTDITSSTTVSVSADVTDSDGTISLVELHWGLVSGSLGNTISMSNGGSGDTYTTTSDIPAQSDGTTVYYEVYAEDDVPESSTSAEYNYTVTDPATTIISYNETFDSDLGDCYTYSVSGATKEWYWYSSAQCASCNGYNSGDTEEDWLIIPAINFDNYSAEVMTFDAWYNYGIDNATNYLKLFYSTNYPGLGDPSSSTWTELSFTPPASSSSWESSGNIDLSGISGTVVYIGFKYHYEVGNYRLWEIDNLLITGGEAVVEPIPDGNPVNFVFDGGGGSGGSTVTIDPPAGGGSITITQYDDPPTSLPFPGNALNLWYDIDGTSYTGGFPVDVTFTWDTPVPVGSSAPILAVSTDGGSSWQEATTTGWNLTTSSYWVTFTASSFSYYAMGNGDDNPLPVTLTSFFAEFVADNLTIMWTTQSENNNLGWNIYRGESDTALEEDNTTQINVGLIVGAGTTSEPTNYEFIDEYPVETNNTYWYWLESVSNSNDTEIYGPTSLTIPEGETPPQLPTRTELYANYPNPFNPETTIDLTIKEGEIGTLSIYNAKGQLIESHKFEAGEYNFEWEASSYSSGVYFYKLESESYSETKKMLMIK